MKLYATNKSNNWKYVALFAMLTFSNNFLISINICMMLFIIADPANLNLDNLRKISKLDEK